MTGGARADRVGAKLSHLVTSASRDLDEREMPAAKAARPLARETSVGGRIALSPGAARFRGAACLTWQRARRTSPVTEHPVLQEQAFDRRKPEGAGDWGGPELGAWGSVGSVVVLAGCLGCRSRRAAFGPGRHGAARQRDERGLAGRLSPCESERKLRGEAALEPDRSGESHEHASSETGGLPVIPCVVRKHGVGRRVLSSMEGVLFQRCRRPLTRRRRRRIARAPVTGMRCGRKLRG
jgi:hypothetical protein